MSKFQVIEKVTNETEAIVTARCGYKTNPDGDDIVCSSTCSSEGSCHDGCCWGWCVDANGDYGGYRCSW